MLLNEPISAPPRASVWHERLLGAAGLASVTLLAASLRWAHHWGPPADAIVSGWAISTLVAGAGSLRLLDREGMVGRLVKLALVCAGISLLALVTAGASYALGADPTGACGGG